MSLPGQSAAPLRILYIDDDADFRVMFKHMLERHGHRVDTESSPTHALDHLRHHRDDFDLVLTDYRMPELNGIEVTVTIRARYPDLRCAVVTSLLSGEVVESASAAGLKLLFEKPSSLKECEDLIRRCGA